MMRSRVLVSFVLTVLASFFVAGVAVAALPCTAEPVVTLACGEQFPDCDEQRSQDCALTCAPMCAAVEPTGERAVAAASPVAIYFPAAAFDWAPGFSGPDPPPPRMA